MASQVSSLEVILTMAKVAPLHPANDSTPDITEAHEIIALFVHSCLINQGFHLCSFDPADVNGMCCDVTCASYVGAVLTSKGLGTDDGDSLAPLHHDWNNSSVVTFVYLRPGSAKVAVVHIESAKDDFVIEGWTKGCDATKHYLTHKTSKFINESFETMFTDDRPALARCFVQAMVSKATAQVLAQDVQDKIILPLIHESQRDDLEDWEVIDKDSGTPRKPGQKRQPEFPDELPKDETKEETLSAQNAAERQPASQNESSNHQESPFHIESPVVSRGLRDDSVMAPPDPFGTRPSRGMPSNDLLPPGFEDPLSMYGNPRANAGGSGFPGGQHPFAIGGSDLYPAGLDPNSGMRPYFGPGVGPGAPGGHMGGGMHPTFDDPLFGGRQPGGQPNPQQPPGARWDPLGPPGPNFGGPGGMGGPGGRFGGGSGGGFGGGFGGFGGGII